MSLPGIFDGIRDTFLPGYEPLFMLVECGSNKVNFSPQIRSEVVTSIPSPASAQSRRQLRLRRLQQKVPDEGPSRLSPGFISNGI